jgi:curved DNA-binding protein CbpA
MPDLYDVLQVSPRAEVEVIRAAYRALARKYHPDHGGNARRMVALNDAWDVLGDPARRAAYDASCTEASNQPSPAAPAPSETGAPRDSGIPRDSGTPRDTAATHAGPPPGRPSGTVLDFGRYAGWSLGEIARHDMDYLEWLQRATFGRRLRAEIDALLAPRRGPAAAGRAPSSRQWNGRR